MFRSFVYLDEEKLYSYLKQIDKDFVNRPMEVNTKRAKGGSIGLSSLNLTAGTETEEKRSYEKDKNLPKKMVEYLLGEFDFYKIISIDNKKITQFQAFNLHEKLGKSNQKAKILVPVVALPTRIVSIDFTPNSNNKVELYLDNGWQFSFRIHNASTMVETSLKFDIQIIGMPANILIIDCPW